MRKIIDGFKNRHARYHAKEREKRNASSRAWYRRNIEKVRKYYHEVDIERRRELMYGLPPGRYEAMCKAQNYCCAACGRKRKLFVDHIHEENLPSLARRLKGKQRVRSLKCHECNIIVGNADDSPEILRAIADCLERESNMLTEPDFQDNLGE